MIKMKINVKGKTVIVKVITHPKDVCFTLNKVGVDIYREYGREHLRISYQGNPIVNEIYLETVSALTANCKFNSVISALKFAFALMKAVTAYNNMRH